MPNSDSGTDCATMSVRTLQHVPNRRVFHMPCDNAMQLQTPTPGTKHQNLGYSPVAPADCPTPRAETAFALVDFYKALHCSFVRAMNDYKGWEVKSFQNVGCLSDDDGAKWAGKG